MHPPLQALEAGLAPVVERDHLAVEHGGGGRHHTGHPGQLGIGRGDLATPAVLQHHPVWLDDCHYPLAVKLRLEQVRRRIRWDTGPAGEHRQQSRRRALRHWSTISHGRRTTSRSSVIWRTA